jgi:hypothetical protein
LVQERTHSGAMAMSTENIDDLRVELDAVLADEELRMPDRHAERLTVVCALLSEALIRTRSHSR